MLNVTKIDAKVHWYEGMLLSPQHFQQSEIYLEKLIANQLQRLGGFYWGVAQFEYDDIALASNQLQAKLLHCVMPDGLVDQYQFNGETSLGEEALSLDLSALDFLDGEIKTIAISVARDGEGAASDSGQELQRYTSVNFGQTSDQNNPDKKIDIVRLVPKVRFGLEQDVSPNHVSLPLMRVKKQADGTFVAQDYTPPTVQLQSTLVVKGSGLSSAIVKVLAKARLRANRLRSLHADRRADEVRSQFQRDRIIHLTARLSAVEVLLDAQSHPFEVYRSLVEYASDVARLNDDPVAPQFQKYNHNDLDASFSGLMRFIDQTIDSVRLDFSAISFVATEPGTFEADLVATSADGIRMLAFKLPIGSNKEEVCAWIESAYVCDQDDYAEMQLKRELGFERNRVREFRQIHLQEGSDEVFYLVEGQVQGQAMKMIISESDATTASVRPLSITSFEIEG